MAQTGVADFTTGYGGNVSFIAEALMKGLMEQFPSSADSRMFEFCIFLYENGIINEKQYQEMLVSSGLDEVIEYYLNGGTS